MPSLPWNSRLAREAVRFMAACRRPLVGRLIRVHRNYLRHIDPIALPAELQGKFLDLMAGYEPDESGNAGASLETMSAGRIGTLGERTVGLMLAIMAAEDRCLQPMKTAGLTQALQAALAAGLRKRNGASPS